MSKPEIDGSSPSSSKMTTEGFLRKKVNNLHILSKYTFGYYDRLVFYKCLLHLYFKNVRRIY